MSSEVGVPAYFADLVVIARPESAGQTASPPDLAQSLSSSSGRAIIVFPPLDTIYRIRRMLAGWNGESIRTVAEVKTSSRIECEEF